jgi:hypothetical protein
VTAGGQRYVIKNPDSAISFVNMNMFRRPATLTGVRGDGDGGGPHHPHHGGLSPYAVVRRQMPQRGAVRVDARMMRVAS